MQILSDRKSLRGEKINCWKMNEEACPRSDLVIRLIIKILNLITILRRYSRILDGEIERDRAQSERESRA